MIFKLVLDTIYQKYNHRLTSKLSAVHFLHLKAMPVRMTQREVHCLSALVLWTEQYGQSVHLEKNRGSFVMDVSEYMVSSTSLLSYLMI